MTTTHEKAHGCDPVGFQITTTNSADSPTVSQSNQRAINSALSADLSLTTTTKEPRADSRLLAQHLGIKHQSLFGLVKTHRKDFEQFGILRFQTGVIDGRGQPEKFVMLNEDQCTLALSYSRNTARVRQLKIKLVKAFGEYRRSADMRQHEYLPIYHELHDAIHLKALESANEKLVHMNVNKLVNKTVGIEAGQRSIAPVPKQAMLIVAQSVAARAMQTGNDHRDGYQLVKQAMLALESITMPRLSVGVQ